ncbi:hypothetical protein D3C77_275190 [compost metagenome]
MTERREITLEVGDKEFQFTLTPQDVTKYFNSLTANNKVAPASNLLSNTVDQELRATLKPMLGNPAFVLQMVGALLEEYAPDIEITVKKHSATLSA